MTLRTRIITHSLITFALFFSYHVAFGAGGLEVKARAWKTMHEACEFPERNYGSVTEYLNEKNSFGVAFSGGGTRSASAAIGQLKALETLGWMDRTMYISAVSGGAWAAVPYIYQPRHNVSEFDFLGDLKEKEPNVEYKISEVDLTKEPPKYSLPYAIENIGFVFPQVLMNLWRGNEAYGQVIGKQFLTDAGIDRKKLFTFNTDSIDTIMQYQPRGVSKELFVTADTLSKPPYLIVGATALPLTKGDGGFEGGKAKNSYPVEITPLYTGIRPNEKFDTKNGGHIGGGYIESFAYDAYKRNSNFQVNNKYGTHFSIKNKNSRFTLADVIGASGAAPVAGFERIPLLPNFVFPKFNHQPINRENSRIWKKLPHGDGGHLDNLAVMPLLIRKVQNILVFINTPTKFNPEKCHSPDKCEITTDLQSYFGVGEEAMKDHPYNEVIDDGSKRFDSLINAYKEKHEAGMPLVHCENYLIKPKVNSQRRYSFNANDSTYTPNICWVYLDKARVWNESIVQDASEGAGKNTRQLRNNKRKFNRFPQFRTFFENWWQGGQIIDLDIPQVNAISMLTNWTVHTSSSYIGDYLGIGGSNQASCKE